MTMKIKIEIESKMVVTQKCIDDGDPTDPERHPVALAMNAYPKKYGSKPNAENPFFRNSCCWVGGVRFTSIDDEPMMGHLDEKGAEWAHTFNARDPVDETQVSLFWTVEPHLTKPIVERWGGVVRGEICGSDGAVNATSAPEYSKEPSKALEDAPLCVTLEAPPKNLKGDGVLNAWKKAMGKRIRESRDALSDVMRSRIYNEELVMRVATAVQNDSRDLDNVHKPIQDLFQIHGVIENDCRVTLIIHEKVQHLSGDKDRVRVVLDVRQPFKNGPISGGYLALTPSS